MTRDELRRLAEALPEGGAALVPKADLLEATAEVAPCPAVTQTSPASAEMLSADEVARRLGTSRRWVYDHQAQLGGRALSPRTLRFSATAVERFAQRGRRAA